jgi:SAM-dependent methyltransferase
VRDSRKELVRDAYDSIADRYLRWQKDIEGDPRDRFLDLLMARLGDGARVLDLGCGAGLPSTARMAERYEVVGVDISSEQIRRARRNVPGATFTCADFSELDFAPGSFDGVTAFYSVAHVPRELHADLFFRIARWLRSGGLLLGSLGAHDGAGWVGEWLGAETFFSSHDAEANSQILRRAGFSLLVDEVVTMREPEEEVDFHWVLAQRSA